MKKSEIIILMCGFKVASLKKERDSLMQKLQQEGPSDSQRTRGLQRENAQVCYHTWQYFFLCMLLLYFAAYL